MGEPWARSTQRVTAQEHPPGGGGHAECWNLFQFQHVTYLVLCLLFEGLSAKVRGCQGLIFQFRVEGVWCSASGAAPS